MMSLVPITLIDTGEARSSPVEWTINWKQINLFNAHFVAIHVNEAFMVIIIRLKSASLSRPRCSRIEFSSRLTPSTPMVRALTLDPTPDAPRAYNLHSYSIIKKDHCT